MCPKDGRQHARGLCLKNINDSRITKGGCFHTNRNSMRAVSVLEDNPRHANTRLKLTIIKTLYYQNDGKKSLVIGKVSLLTFSQ